MDILQDILKTIENSDLSDSSYGSIKQENNNILQKLHFKNIKNTLDKLKYYKYCNKISDLRYGSYIRYIKVDTDKEFKLEKGGFIIKTNIINNDIIITCKNTMNLIFNIYFSKSVIFQKLSNDEIIILDAIKYLKL